MLTYVRASSSSLSRALNLDLSRSENTHGALRALKSESYSRSLNYCVLFYGVCAVLFQSQRIALKVPRYQEKIFGLLFYSGIYNV